MKFYLGFDRHGRSKNIVTSFICVELVDRIKNYSGCELKHPPESTSNGWSKIMKRRPECGEHRLEFIVLVPSLCYFAPLHLDPVPVTRFVIKSKCTQVPVTKWARVLECVRMEWGGRRPLIQESLVITLSVPTVLHSARRASCRRRLINGA